MILYTNAKLWNNWIMLILLTTFLFRFSWWVFLFVFSSDYNIRCAGRCSNKPVWRYRLCYCLKWFGHINIILCWSFQKWNSIFIGQSFSHFSADNSIGRVSFIGYNHFFYVFVGMAVDLFHPVSNICEGFFIRDVVCKDYAHCSFVVSLCNSSKSFLSCSIPDL